MAMAVATLAFFMALFSRPTPCLSLVAAAVVVILWMVVREVAFKDKIPQLA